MSTKVLLVDDEVDYVNALSQRLTARGLQVEIALNGRDAIEKAKAEYFDAIVLDYAMPGIDGLETLKELKHLNPNIQVIMLTGHATVDTGVKAIKEGATDLLQKPVELKTLIDKIGEAAAKTVHFVERANEEQIQEILMRRSW